MPARGASRSGGRSETRVPAGWRSPWRSAGARPEYASSRRARSTCSTSSVCRFRVTLAAAPSVQPWRPEPMDPVDERSGAVFGVLSDPTRRRLLSAVAAQPQITATELAADLPISRQAVVKHLSALAEAGLLDRRRSGREVHYRITPEPLSQAVSWMAQVGGHWDARLARLARQFPPR